MNNDSTANRTAIPTLRLNREKLKTFTVQSGLKTGVPGASCKGTHYPTSCPVTRVESLQ